MSAPTPRLAPHLPPASLLPTKPRGAKSFPPLPANSLRHQVPKRERKRQAEAEGHSWQDEMTLTVVHGTLHLLGYDHDTVENQARMWAVQAEALAALEVPIVVPLFSFDDDSD